MLLPRTLTAVVGIPLILVAIHTGGLLFVLFAMGVSLFSLYEALRLFSATGLPSRILTGMAAGAAFFALTVLTSSAEPGLVLRADHPSALGAGLALIVVLVTGAEIFSVKSRSITAAATTVFSILFVVWPMAHLVLLRDLFPLGRIWCYLLFGAIWCCDVTAYATGFMLGGRKLAPRVSPKKTIAGFIGGLVGACAAACAFWVSAFRGEGLGFGELLAVGGLGIGTVGQLSDLVESVLKREAKAKDSADILPGHGGFLDRFDSFLLTTPLLYYYLVFRP